MIIREREIKPLKTQIRDLETQIKNLKLIITKNTNDLKQPDVDVRLLKEANIYNNIKLERHEKELAELKDRLAGMEGNKVKVRSTEGNKMLTVYGVA
jgi:chromosome segregation ATPase